MEKTKKEKCRAVTLLKRWCRRIALSVAAVLAFVGLLLTIVVFILSPARLTPLVNKYATRYINGEVTASRIELTFWSSFPRLSIDVDSLAVVSGALKNLPPELRAKLPVDADTLLTLRSLHGGINLPALLAGKYELYNVALSRPAVNIVVVSDSVANYNIVPDNDDADEPSAGMPRIGINRFLLLNSGPVKYFSLPDSTDVALQFTAIDANGTESPLYSLSTEGNARIAGMTLDHDKPLLFTADGDITWDLESPDEIALEKFDISIDGIQARISTHMKFGDSVVVERLKVDMPSVDVMRVAGYMPSDIKESLTGFDTNMSVGLSYVLTHPYNYDPDNVKIPSGVLSLTVPPCRLAMAGVGVAFDHVALEAKADINGDSVALSSLEIGKMVLKSRMLDLDLKGNVDDLLGDMMISGQLQGRVNLGRLPSVIRDSILGEMRGVVGADLRVRLRQSDLAADRFHRIYAGGRMSLRDFDMVMPMADAAGDTMRVSTPAMYMRFDSDKRIEVKGVKTDSLLTVSISTDSLAYSGSGISVMAQKLSVGLGSRNVHSSADTTRINPFGGKLVAERLRLVSEPDSLKLLVNNLETSGALQRYQGDDKVPLLSLAVSADGIAAGNSEMRAGVRYPSLDIKAHINKRGSDTIKVVNRRTGARMNETDTVESGLKELIRRWQVAGNLTATHGQILARSLPLSTRISDLDLNFTTDSITLRSFGVQVGRSDLSVRGRIGNLERWASRSRRRRNAMTMEVKVSSDTIDIDQLTAALLPGDSLDEDLSGHMQELDDEDLAVSASDNAASDSTGPFIVPVDIAALLDLEAKNVIYSGMLLHDFAGQLQTRGGILRLRDLSATGNVGRIDFSALYSSLYPDSLEFGMGLKLSDFYLERFLDMMPSVAELLPAMKDLRGIVNADIAATTRLDSEMNFIMPTLKAMIDISGDSLVLLDDQTFKSMSKWLVFKNKKRNLIEKMTVKISVDSSRMQIYPFIFDIDRYRLGVMGSNDLDMNLNYHVSVLKSPLPWKFGINITGNIDDYKIRLGGAKVKEGASVEQLAISDTTRINLVSQLETLFNRGLGASRSAFTRRRSLSSSSLDSSLTLDPADTVPVEIPDSLLP